MYVLLTIEQRRSETMQRRLSRGQQIVRCQSATMRVHLSRKLAESVDGVDLSAHRAGDTFDLPDHEAELLIAEQWAVAEADDRKQEVRLRSFALPGAEAADSVRSRVGRIAQQLADRHFESQPHRRIEDRVLDELHDGREQTVSAIRPAAARPARPTGQRGRCPPRRRVGKRG